MIEKRMNSLELVDRMTKEQIRDYWYELKQTRYDGYYYRELHEKIMEMNPNLVMPDTEAIKKIEKEALSIAFWEENWEIKNERRIKDGGQDYSLFRKKPEADRKRSFSLERKVL